MIPTTWKLAAAGIAIVLALAAAAYAIIHYGNVRYDAGVAYAQVAQAKSNAKAQVVEDKLQATAATAASSALAAGQQHEATAAATTRTVIQTVTRIVHEKPAPAECVVPADSVRELTAARDTAIKAGDRLSGARSPAAAATTTQPAQP